MNGNVVLSVSNLSVEFPLRGGLFRRAARLQAVQHLSFELRPHEVLGIVGESGSGKSTTARAILRLEKPSEGTIWMDGEDVSTLSERQFRMRRRKIQMVFQDPYSSLDPSMVIADSIGEPLEIHGGLRGGERDRRVAELLSLVGLGPQQMNRYPHEFSGGQRQRIAIARAIAMEPSILVCDEAVSALDVSTQNQIINLLADLRERLGMAYLFISHDLAVVRHIADRVLVMYLGRAVEEGPSTRIFEAPAHPYTRALLDALPTPNPATQRRKRKNRLEGELPDPASLPKGCAFQTRCPRVMQICRTEAPSARPVSGGGSVACHLHPDEPAAPPQHISVTSAGIDLTDETNERQPR
ncbi:ABC transporter ATP-binding protein [Pseudonocardia asaccharolytica]|uniref:ABC transporter ATP-binding protein n=1 Tax=Pseudonocardia asaccharolytica DSM 44247 = NBRC 16224 TaxID=1123024 RepID=A0A511CXD9_9PSEU|nr:oligopeptide/dipeptide ABC transporter ATP-binding protein [Pseudonocardia asaccharolytica]GEL17225.1 ABC transporter ATP-binding protein [Pseudonocardia asaccharolytica DSM 44247 = NBRC 16224]